MMAFLKFGPTTRLAIVLAAFTIIFALKFGIVGGILLAIPISIALVYAVGFYRRATITQRNLHLVERAPNLVTPHDGEVVAVCGAIEPLGETLRSPVSDEISAAYHYKFDRVVISGPKSSLQWSPGGGRTSMHHVDYTGYAVVPVVVRGPGITAALASFPALHDFGEIVHKIEDETRPSLENFKRYIASATFEHVIDVRVEMLDVNDMVWDGRRKFTKDFRRHEGIDPAVSNFLEQRVHPGTSVCAIGVWSEGQKALVRGEKQAVELYPGTPEQMRERFASDIIRGNRRAFVLGGVTILIALLLILR